MEQQLRFLTIHKKFSPRVFKYICVPEIILRGKLLEKLGFTIGSVITIEAEPAQLIITANETVIPVPPAVALARRSANRYTPLRLTPEEIENPFVAAGDFFDAFDLDDIRNIFRILVSNTCLLDNADLGGFQRPSIRMYREEFERMAEACYLICKQAGILKLGKLVA